MVEWLELLEYGAGDRRRNLSSVPDLGHPETCGDVKQLRIAYADFSAVFQCPNYAKERKLCAK